MLTPKIQYTQIYFYLAKKYNKVKVDKIGQASFCTALSEIRP